MKTKHSFFILSTLLLILLSIFLFLHYSRSPDKYPISDPASKLLNPPLNARQRAPKDARLIKRDDQPNLDPETIRIFLEDSNNSAESTVLAYLLTFSPRYLEGLKSHSDSEIALQILAQYDVGCESRIFWAEKLQEKKPTNGLSRLLLARAQIECGRRQEAISSIDEALNAETITSALTVLPQNLKKLFDDVSSAQHTQLAIQDVISAQLAVTMDLFPQNFEGFFKEKSQDEAQEIASNLLKIIDGISSDSSYNLLKIDGFRDSSNATTGLRIGLLLAFENAYGEGSSKFMHSEGFHNYLEKTKEESERSRDEIYRLSPEEVDARVKEAIENL